MDEEKINSTPPRVPEEQNEALDEAMSDEMDREEIVDDPIGSEPSTDEFYDDTDIDEPTGELKVHDGSVEEPIDEPIDNEMPEPKEPIDETPVGEPVDDEPVTEPIPEEPTPTDPEPVAGISEPPMESGNPDLIASAEAEAPAEQAPVFPIETNPQPKSKKPLVLAMVAFLILALGGTGLWYFLLRDKGTSEPVAQNQQTVEPIEQKPYENIGHADDKLSDFDLSFIRLENTQENLIYSPLSIKYALAMLSDASAGETKSQIDAVIGDYRPKAYLNSENRSLANGMFIRTDFSDNVKSSYIDTLQNKYYAEVIYDSFATPDNANQWVSDKTLGIIKNTFNENTVNPQLDYMLVNALAIDMQWNYKIQCNFNGDQEGLTPSKRYGVYYNHEEYYDSTNCMSFPTITFNGHDNTESGKVAASINRYDIISDKGEEYIRQTVQAAFDEWIASDERWDSTKEYYANNTYDMDAYIKDLSENLDKNATSTDFYFNITDDEKIFAKDLKEYDGSTLQYVGIMPITSSLSTYIDSLTAQKITSLIASLKDPSDNDNFKQGVVTKLNGNIPFFKYNYTMDDLMDNLQNLGITDVFSSADADLSNMITFDTTLPSKPYISDTIHKADIDFSNDGIKAAAVTAFGGMGAAGDDIFEYKWEVPVEEIDLTFDKPFLFLIRDKSTGEVWFVGTVYEGKVAE